MSHKTGQWKDLILPVTALTGGTLPTFGVFSGDLRTYEFQTGDVLHGSFEIQHDYIEGSELYVHVHWAPSTTNTGNCIFLFDYSIASVGTAFPVQAQLSATQAGGGVALQHQLATFTPTISGAIKIGNIIAFRLVRTATGNTFTGNAFVFSIGVHYKCDALGSNQMLTKD